MRRFLSVALVALLLGSAVRAAPVVNGEYDSPLGRVRVEGDGTHVRGVLLAPAGPCRFTVGDLVLRATLLDDSLAGEVRVCQTGCEAVEAWAPGVLVVGPGGLAGAVHLAPGCRSPIGPRGGISFSRTAPVAPAGAAGATPPVGERSGLAAPDATGRARTALREGASWLREGNFERARARFLEAVTLDPRLPEAYNGVGVTYRLRDDFQAALGWYKRALGVDPDFGDAYYNMACVYALAGQPDLALRYLQIAAVNGYATAEGIGEDPDLATLRGLPAYRALVRARM
jgi:hypothetical protein